ncbi:MAG: putative signaling protein [Frankiales bacterium]|nr:putative signaling protein [Frankiales bacterium]
MALPVLPTELVEVLDALPDGHALFVAERDDTGQVVALRGVFMNKAGLAIRELTLEEFIGINLLGRTHGLGHAVVQAYAATPNAGQEMHRTLVTDALAPGQSVEVSAKRLLLGGHEMVSASFRDVTQELRSRRRMQRAVELSAVHSRTDELTGLPNRRGWQSAVDAAFSSAKGAVSVAIADLDHFKVYNDTFGHPAGDRLLRDLAGGWSQLLSTQQYLARLGGEEFSILLPDMDAHVAAQALEKFCSAVPARQTVSIGVATRHDEESASQVLARADEALYIAKRAGRARVVIAD